MRLIAYSLIGLLAALAIVLAYLVFGRHYL
jgi:hypothetical protein